MIIRKELTFTPITGFTITVNYSYSAKFKKDRSKMLTGYTVTATETSTGVTTVTNILGTSKTVSGLKLLKKTDVINGVGYTVVYTPTSPMTSTE